MRTHTLNFNKNILFLILIICFFLFTRFYKISEIPPSVYWDEASIGYNAYSILKTGRDEWGDFLPIHFRAFGEFKLPVFIYSTIPFVKLFGLNEFSIRLSSVLFSLGVVILTYLVAKKIYGDFIIALLSSFFMSISPWFFIFSRTGYEATAGLFFYLLAILIFFFKNKGGIFIFFSVASFILSAYSYNSFRIISPITLLIFFFLEIKNFKNIFKKSLKWIILSLLLIFISVWPIYKLYVYDTGILRFQTVSGNGIESLFVNYISHFSLDFLFISGDYNLRSHVPGAGQLFISDIILLPIGLLYIMRNKSKYVLLPIFLTLIAPIPAAITKESPHSLRAISTIPFVHIISALGVAQLLKHIPRINLVISMVILVSTLFFLKYFTNFVISYPLQSSKDWQYGYKQIYTNYAKEFINYDRILISDTYAQPYIFTLFYLKYDPVLFLNQGVRNSVSNWGFSTVAKIGKFEFGKIKELSSLEEEKVLIFVASEETFPNQDSLRKIGEVKFLDNSTAFWVYQK